MKKLVVAIVIFFCAFVPTLAQTPVDFRVNTYRGFSSPEGDSFIVVNFPGKTARQIYNMMAINIGVLYYEPAEVMYGVQDAMISVATHKSDFCQNGSQAWSAKYIVKFLIKDGKVLVFSPIVLNLTMKNTRALSVKTLDFIDFINQYWYNKNSREFVSSETGNMAACESGINEIINKILGITSTGLIPKNW